MASHFPEYWKNPEEFNPYRFDDDEVLRRYSDKTKIYMNYFFRFFFTVGIFPLALLWQSLLTYFKFFLTFFQNGSSGTLM